MYLLLLCTIVSINISPSVFFRLPLSPLRGSVRLFRPSLRVVRILFFFFLLLPASSSVVKSTVESDCSWWRCRGVGQVFVFPFLLLCFCLSEPLLFLLLLIFLIRITIILVRYNHHRQYCITRSQVIPSFLLYRISSL